MRILVFDKDLGFLSEMRKLEPGPFEVLESDVFDVECDAFVSPANSFGFMDGGIDDCYRKMFPGAEAYVKHLIRSVSDGELPVGKAISATLTAGSHKTCNRLIVAPTMRVPALDLNGTPNAYLATKAAVALARQRGVQVLAIPGMGTGPGRLDKGVAARQMALGIEHGMSPPNCQSWLEAHRFHWKVIDGRG